MELTRNRILNQKRAGVMRWVGFGLLYSLLAGWQAFMHKNKPCLVDCIQ